MAIRQVKVSSLLNLPSVTKEEFIPEQPAAPTSVESLKVKFALVAGGGGGGAETGAGGGGGGVLISELTVNENQALTVTVGLGGAGGTAVAYARGGAQGQNTVFSTAIAIGGGGGGANQSSPTNGGSGGGAFSTSSVAGAGTAGQGFNGGCSASFIDGGPAGGGGAGGKGGDGNLNRNAGDYFWGSHRSGSGGPGITIPLLRNSGYFAGGGGAGAAVDSWDRSSGYGGIGGGGRGGNNSFNAATGQAGGVNTGGGAGGGSWGGSLGGAGGSGIIFLSVPKTFRPVFSAGVVFTVESSSSDPNYGLFKITAAGATDTVTFKKVRPIVSDSPTYKKYVNVKYTVRSKKLTTKLDTISASSLYTETSTTATSFSQKAENIIDKSLSLTYSRSSSMTKTFASAGNRKTWTFSCWFKPAARTDHILLQSYQDSSNYTRFYIDWYGKLLFKHYAVSNWAIDLGSSEAFFDVTKWNHFVISYDSTNTVQEERVKIYVNGTLLKLELASYPALNDETFISAALEHKIQTEGNLADVRFLDGIVAKPEKFGEKDLATGLWVPKTGIAMDYLVVAGGGGGGSARGGGGGAGGLQQGSMVFTRLNVPVSLTVGLGGAGGVYSNSTEKGANGGNSVFDAIVCTGGGGGGGGTSASTADQAGQNGGSGGGANAASLTAGLGNTPATTVAQGTKGGKGISGDCGGGGGGAAGRGSDAIGGGGGRGGPGVYSNLSGTLQAYAGGGGGGVNGYGGEGGGAYSSYAATVNTGGGGGGGTATGNGGNGGSGIIILRYPETTKATFSSGVTHNTFTQDGLTTSIVLVAGASDTVMFV